MNDEPPLQLALSGEADTVRLGEDLALALKAGDCLALSGDLGAGKSTLARAFLRAMADDDDLEVPSPTFTLVQAYDLRIPVAHFDLYRLADGSELDELGFDEALNDGICLVEWPEMADAELPGSRIRLTLVHDGDSRRAEIHGPKPALDRIRRVLAIRAFLRDNGHGEARRRFLTGDASLRAYETITDSDGKLTILMDWPLRPEGPPVMDGKAYPKVAHLAEDAYPFVAIAEYLRHLGLAAPQILAVDYAAGLLLIEHLGFDGVLDADGAPIAQRYRESVACLAHLHQSPLQRDLAVTPHHMHRVPDFDPVAMKIETRLILDWYLPWQRKGGTVSEAERLSYGAVWDGLIEKLKTSEHHLLLRDMHSPNLIWREAEQGLQRVGLIDFQDAMIGPTAYDVASLVQDARVTISPALGNELLQHYLALRHQHGNFDEASFREAFAIMAAQRNCKLAGLWVRLKDRDGKPGYMKHMPRTLAYLSSALQHPVLAPLRDWMAEARIDFRHS
ncbi:tRNA (adenosine(37)-N6)-threonylcarbamoyltransferase complex ATPase subunit type 1 TsaE [Rhizobium sp. SGZ-381]|uniref:tRNA (adenosine(37)-N6)-threonylcarbamoyltransferase complex ATPase subunit type 1 TsaE n=1 Tax=Rhizobium sp. SGZ-381 TaxID=3342800 RepID=UPI0036714FA1